MNTPTHTVNSKYFVGQ